MHAYELLWLHSHQKLDACANPHLENNVHRGEERVADIYVQITDDGEVMTENVNANFGQLNPNMQYEVQPDGIIDGKYVWRNIPVTEVANCKVTISATEPCGYIPKVSSIAKMALLKPLIASPPISVILSSTLKSSTSVSNSLG